MGTKVSPRTRSKTIRRIQGPAHQVYNINFVSKMVLNILSGYDSIFVFQRFASFGTNVE